MKTSINFISSITGSIRHPFLKAGLFAAALASAGALQGAVINWGAAVNITGDTNVTTAGESLYAYDWANATVIVNGVSFIGSSTTGASANITDTLDTVNATAFNSGSSPFSSLSSAYQSMLIGSVYRTHSGDTVTLNNLTIGHSYTVQVWVNDPRGPENGRNETLTAGGNSVNLAFTTNTSLTGGIPGQFTIGNFTADTNTQSFTVTGNAVDQINALQVRDLSVVPGAPIVTTGSPGDFSTNSATLNGLVNPNGFPASAKFIWGTTTNYGNVTSSTNLSASYGVSAINSVITGLSPGVTYHFAAIATNTDASVQGADQSFALPSGMFSSSSPVFYSTFGPNYAYTGLESRLAEQEFYIAMPLTPKFTGALGHIVVPIYNVMPPDQIRFTLTTDNGGVPGTTLETWSLTDLVDGALTTINSVQNPILTKGVPYWLVASADVATTQSYWRMGPMDGSIPSGNLSSTDQGHTWSFFTVLDCAFEMDAANPTITGIATTGTNLSLTAANGIAGLNYVTLMGTNANQPLHTWQPLATNQLSVSGNFSIFATNAINSGLSHQYYILKAQ